MRATVDNPMRTGESHAHPAICGAKSKRSGLPCKGRPVTGSPRCRMHGGTNHGAPITTGRWSKSLGKFAADFEAAAADRDLLDFRRVISGLDMICARLGARAAEHDTTDYRKRALALFNTAADSEDPMSAMRNLGAFLEEGVAEDRVFRELRDSYATLAEKIEGAMRVKLAKEQSINVKDANAWILQFLLTVRELCGVENERKVRERIGETVARAARN